jgi:hypothetical protein
MDTGNLINEATAKAMTYALKQARTVDPEKMDRFMGAIDLVDEIADAIADEEVTAEEAQQIIALMRKGGSIETFMKMLLAEVGIKI